MLTKQKAQNTDLTVFWAFIIFEHLYTFYTLLI